MAKRDDYALLDEKTEDRLDQYSRGEISEAELMMEAPAQTGRAVGSVLGYPIEAYLKYTPPGIAASTYMGWIFKNALESDPGQAAQQWMEENPRTVDNISSALDISELFPASAMVRRGMNAVMANVQTKLPGFYNGRQIGAFWDQLVETPEFTLKQLFTPQGQANVREKGEFAGERRLDETQTGVQKDKTGNVLATDLMGTQSAGRYGQTGLTGDTSIVKESYVGRHMDYDKQAIIDDLGVDPVIGEDLYDRAMKVHSGTNKLERGLQFIADPLAAMGLKTPAMVGVRNPRSGYGNLHLEAGAVDGKGSVALNMFKGPEGLRYAKMLGKDSVDDLNAKEIKEFLEVGNVFERGNWYGVKAELGLPEATPRQVLAKYITAKKKDPLERSPEQIKLVNAIDKRKSGQYTPSKPLPWEKARYYYLKNKKGELKPEEQDFVNWYDEGRPAGGANVQIEKLSDGREVIKYRTSFTSGDTDLGGVSGGYTIDPSEKAVYGMVSDQHDMFGVNPIGGRDMYNVSQVQKTHYGSAKEPKQEIFNRGKQTDAGKARMAKDSAALEKKTGIPKEKGESDYGYQLRAVREYNAKIRAQDYAQAGANIGMMGTAITPDNATEGGSMIGEVIGKNASQLFGGK